MPIIRYELRNRRYLHFWDIVKEIRPRNILEVGVAQGSSARIILMEAVKHREHVSYWGIDLFEDLTEEKAREISRYGNSKKYLWPGKRKEVESDLEFLGADLNLIRGDSSIILPKMEGPKMDLIFIDGDHRTEVIARDWNNVRHLMHRDTVVVFDDYWTKGGTEGFGSREVVDKIKKSKEFKVEILKPGDEYNHNDYIKIFFAKVICS